MRPLTFEPFVRAQTASLLRLAYLLTNDASDAEDLVQEALLSALRHWDRVQAAERPAAYLRRMLVNNHISAQRRQWSSEVAIDADILMLVDARDVSARSALDAVDARYWALTAMRSLPARQRAVLVLRYYEGMDDGEIGELLDVGRSSVRSLAARAFAALRAHPELASFDDPLEAGTAAAAPTKESD